MRAQEAPPPALTEPQRQRVQLAMKDVEIAQLRLALAQREAEKATQDAQAMLKGLVVPGWTLDLSTLAYTKTPVPASTPQPSATTTATESKP